MENDLRSIMELLQKGIITPEEAEKMINEIQGNKDYSRKATETAKNIGEKIGGVIDDFVPMTKGVLKTVFQTTADLSQKMANKMDTQNDGTSDFDNSFFTKNQGFESDFESDYEPNDSAEEVVKPVNLEKNVVNTTVENEEEGYNDVGVVEKNLFEEPTENEHMIEIEKL